MTYKETLAWMYAQLPMYQKNGKSAYTAKLDNIQRLAEHLRHPEQKFKSIHIAGTNGKGSSSHMLASILQEAGYTVGLYTSPHLKDFRERIRINGKPVDLKFVTEFITRHRAYFETSHLSFFEMTVGMAFDYFAKKKVDIAIIEVGMGGRLDSTNIVLPEVSLITNIGLDHTDILGETLEAIAHEKAGIIKEGIPVVVSETQEETKDVFKSIASHRHAPLVYADQMAHKVYQTDLLGNYQSRNIKGVLAVLQQLKGFKVQQKHIVKGLRNVVKNTGLKGRWQLLGTRPMVVCDTAHNAEGLSLVIDQILQQKFEGLHFVLGFVKEKKLEGVMPLLPKNAIYYFCRPKIARGLDEKVLKQNAEGYGLHGKAYSSVRKALGAAKRNASAKDFIFVGGSNFVVAEVV
ncbi:MAG: folylpolyglutamate synthase/dihydrofolate synthase family protein [Flavobacteriaceae bacterium]